VGSLEHFHQAHNRVGLPPDVVGKGFSGVHLILIVAVADEGAVGERSCKEFLVVRGVVFVQLSPMGKGTAQYDSYLYSGGFSFTSTVCAPASVAVIPSTAKPATPIITLCTDPFIRELLTEDRRFHKFIILTKMVRFGTMLLWCAGALKSDLGGSRAR